jgi:hypothetical protein
MGKRIADRDLHRHEDNVAGAIRIMRLLEPIRMVLRFLISDPLTRGQVTRDIDEAYRAAEGIRSREAEAMTRHKR